MRHIFGMNVVSHLLALVTEDLILASFDVTLEKVTQKPV
jgi:hypothetical protein